MPAAIEASIKTKVIQQWLSGDSSFISMAIDGGLFLNVGNFSREAPGMLVGFFSQSWPSLKN
jgi:hypothetical protein